MHGQYAALCVMLESLSSLPKALPARPVEQMEARSHRHEAISSHESKTGNRDYSRRA